MSKTLELEVTGDGNRLKAFLDKHETELEADATEIIGERVDIRILDLKSRKASLISSAPTPFRMSVKQIRQGAAWREALESMVSSTSAGGPLASLLIVERAFVNDPDFQSKIFSQAVWKHFRLLVKDREVETKQFLSTFRDLFSSLLSEAVEEDPRAEERAHPPYLRVSRSIRNEASGRLDAKKVAKFFDLKPAELARIVGVSRQALDQTPDSKGIQKALYPFEEITRGLLMVNDDRTLLLQWLNTPSRDLPKVEGQHMTPMDMIRAGHPSVIAGLVDNTLTGHPS